MPAEPILVVSLLGPFRCGLDSGESVRIPGTRGKALLACLAVATGKPVARAQLAAMLWPDRPEAAGRTNLRKTLSRIKQSLTGVAAWPIEVDGESLRLDLERVDIDLSDFTACLDAATPQSLLRASHLYRGPFLQGFRDCGEAFEEWLSAHRRDYYERALDGLRRLSDHYAIVGAVDQAIRVTLKLLDLDPLDERSHRTLIRLYLSQDRIGAACVQYRRCRDLLNSELGAAPSAETESLRALLLDSYPVDSLDDEAVVAEDDELPESPQAPEIAQANRERARRDLGDAASVAVLPSAPQPAFEHLLPIVEGVAEEVSIALGRVRNLRVFSPSAVIACRDLGLSSEVAGNDLGARYTVTLGVRETDEGLTLLLRLLETRDGRLLWGDRFECSRDELFRVQRQVVEKIISTLLGTIEAAEYERAQRVLTTSWPAYELMNHGWRQLRQLDLGSIDRARNLFHQSLEKDPDLARAYLGLALAHLREWACNSWNMWFFVPETAVNYARKALELDEFDGRAHCILGLCELYGDNQQLAEKRIERSLELNPNDSDILAHSACALALLGEHRHATDCAGRALQLSPYRPDWYASFTGFAYMTARRYDDGIRIMSEAPEAVCDTPSYLATCYAHQGRIEESKRYADTLLRHYRRQIARGDYDAATSCLDWLMSMAPYRRDTDREHFLEGLKLAGF